MLTCAPWQRKYPGEGCRCQNSSHQARSPITRAEGERRLIDAAYQLTTDRPISEVGVREIATLADVNAGFVHTWFGSKNDLLVAVVKQQIAEIAELALQAKPGTAALSFEDPKLICVIRLLLWLHLEGVKVEHLFYNKIILDILTKRFIEIENIDPKIAREAATIAISIALAVGTFAPMLEMTGVSEVQPVRDLWRHILSLLAQYPPQ
jgi:AcrR family transcriptional regulator